MCGPASGAFIPAPTTFRLLRSPSGSAFRRYGNADSAGPGSQVPEPEIAFAWPAFVSISGGRLFVGDCTNRRITVVKFAHAAEEVCEVR